MSVVCVTGAGGFLGCHLTEALLLAGHHVIALDNFSEQRGTLNHLCHHKNLEIVRGDCRRMRILQPLAVKADIIIPLAALVGVDRCEQDAKGADTTNREAIDDLCAAATKDQRIIFPCTNSGYGLGGEDVCTEESPMQPISRYGETKRRAELSVMQRENSISFRFATLFGMSPRMRWGLLTNYLVKQAVTEKYIVLFESSFKRNFLSVHDAARVFLHAIENFESMRGNIYNVGLSDANLSKLELAQKIKAHLPQTVILDSPLGTDEDKRNYVISNAKIEATGFKPKFSLDDGITELIKGVACAD